MGGERIFHFVFSTTTTTTTVQVDRRPLRSLTLAPGTPLWAKPATTIHLSFHLVNRLGLRGLAKETNNNYRGAADQFKITAGVFGGEGNEEDAVEKKLKEESRGRMVFPGQLSLLQAVGEHVVLFLHDCHSISS